jgi:hypothetical protein
MKRLRLTLLVTSFALVVPAFGFEPSNVIPATGTIEYPSHPGTMQPV